MPIETEKKQKSKRAKASKVMAVTNTSTFKACSTQTAIKENDMLMERTNYKRMQWTNKTLRALLTADVGRYVFRTNLQCEK